MAKRGKRKLVDITLDEAIEVLKLGEGFYKDNNYQLRVKDHIFGGKFAQLYHVYKSEETIDANFSDNRDAVTLCWGNNYYRTHYRIVKYLEGRGFDLILADKKN